MSGKIPTDVSIAGDGDYRRGVVHGLEIAWRLMKSCKISGRFRKKLADACNLSMEFRYDRKSHPVLMDDILSGLAHIRSPHVPCSGLPVGPAGPGRPNGSRGANCKGANYVSP
ncbi:MAG: hypothetical protein MUP16_05560 [Sedimentisphaerales bacterium]|nr:hypothetical protein [Sedimentisphaerales bacterium]